jgi:hypothetical protein
MIRKALIAILILYTGILIGEISVGNSTIGRTAWEQTLAGLNWSGDQAHSLAVYAGLGDSSFMKWFAKPAVAPKPEQKTIAVGKPTPAPVPRKPVAAPSATAPAALVETDPEGLTPLDKEALRNILE